MTVREAAQTFDRTGRSVTEITRDWRFALGDPEGAEQPGFDDSGWRRLDLPHDWSIEAPFDAAWASGTGYLPGGVGWYRKHLALPHDAADRRLVIAFDGVYKNSDVWINGHHLGRRPNGYIAFQYDLTPCLEPGGENVLAVRVDHADFADSRWYTGSGIYRSVRLVATDPVHIGPWGVHARTANVLSDTATLQLSTTVVNARGEAVPVTVRHRLLRDGDEVAAGQTDAEVAAGASCDLKQVMKVRQPALWDTDTPGLYHLETTVHQGSTLLDREETVLGFRDLRFDPAEGFFLNGRSVKLKGICMHHDAGCLGAAVPLAVLRRRLGLLKEMGCNAIRTSHNPFAAEFLDLCDQMGFLVINEMFDEWEEPKRKWVRGWNQGDPSLDGYARDFAEWHRQDLTDFVRRDRNHPSVIMWSIGNEIDYPNDPYTHEILDTEDNPQTFARFNPKYPHADRLGEAAQELAEIVRHHDPDRPVTAGLASALMAIAAGYADALDVAGYNYQEFRYAEDHHTFPQRPLYGSENSKAASAWQAVLDRDDVMGQFLWTGFDYLGEAGQFPWRNSTAGTLDLAGNRKPEFYLRQSLWCDQPMVFIGAGEPVDKEDTGLWAPIKTQPHWNWEHGRQVQIDGYSNCEEVELFLNGTSLGRRRIGGGADTRVTWHLPFTAGTLTAVGLNDGREAARFELKTAGEASGLRLGSDVYVLTAGSHDVAHVAVTVVDGDGTRVWDAAPRLRCDIQGPAKLLGMEDANPRNTEPYSGNERNAFRGRMLLYVQPLGEPGQATITLCGDGLTTASLRLPVIG